MEHTDCFHFPQITNKNSKFTFRRLQFSTFTTSSLHLWRSVDADFFISLAYVTSGKKSSFWFWYIPASMGLNTRKNMTFWPLNLYYRRSDWGTWLSETFPEALTSKLWNKKKYMLQKLTEMERNWIMLIPLRLYQESLTDPFTG